MREALDAVARPATLCAFCPKMCRFACPVSETEKRDTVTPWGKMSIVWLAREGEVALGDPDAHQAMEACTGCGACVEACAHGNPVAETLFTARGLARTERSERYRAAFEQTGDVKRRDLDAGLAKLPRDREARLAYFPGCTRLSGPEDDIRKDRAALARVVGAQVPSCEPPARGGCCGYPLYADGQLDLLEAHLARLWESMKGHQMVITPDPGCAYMLTVVRRGLGIDDDGGPAVIPLVEALAQNVEAFRGASEGVVLRYHDPCYLGRRGRTFSAPRRLLEAACGRPPEEFSASHDDADCSGGGGLYPVSSPENAHAMAHRRAFADPKPGPARAVVTACPTAKKTFARAGVPVLDVVDVLLGEVMALHDAAWAPGVPAPPEGLAGAERESRRAEVLAVDTGEGG